MTLDLTRRVQRARQTQERARCGKFGYGQYRLWTSKSTKQPARSNAKRLPTAFNPFSPSRFVANSAMGSTDCRLHGQPHNLLTLGEEAPNGVQPILPSGFVANSAVDFKANQTTFFFGPLARQIPLVEYGFSCTIHQARADVAEMHPKLLTVAFEGTM